MNQNICASQFYTIGSLVSIPELVRVRRIESYYTDAIGRYRHGQFFGFCWSVNANPEDFLARPTFI